MKRVLFVILGLDYSGAENVLIQYLEGNNEIDPYFVFIYNGAASVEFGKKFEKGRLKNLNLPYDKNMLRLFPCIAQQQVKKSLMAYICENRPEAIYFNNTHEVILGRKLLKKLDIPCIGHIHDMKNSLGSPAKRYEARKAFEELDEVFTVSLACKESWLCERMKVIYNGLPDDFFAESEIKLTHNSSVTIGYVGMISDRKGFDILSDVIKSNQLSVNWKIAYNLVQAKYENELKAVEEKDNVEVIYKIPASQMVMFYDSIDILVIPSRQDPLPTVAIEAMTRKKLVIGFRVGGIPELIGDDRLIVNEVSAEALKSKIQEVITWSEDTRKEIADSIHKRSIELFSQTKKKSSVNSIIDNAVSVKSRLV